VKAFTKGNIKEMMQRKYYNMYNTLCLECECCITMSACLLLHTEAQSYLEKVFCNENNQKILLIITLTTYYCSPTSY
jgi:hypothetical protein